MKHIRVCQSHFTCRNCQGPIKQGDKYFSNYIHKVGFYTWATLIPFYRVHLKCVINTDFCCSDAEKEFSEYFRKNS